MVAVLRPCRCGRLFSGGACGGVCGAAGVPGAGGLCRAGLLCAPVGGGPPASRPRCEPLARRVVSKPGQAPPPPTGTAAWPSGPSGALRTSGAWCAVGWLGVSARCLARPRRRPRAPQPGPPVPPAPSTPVEPGVLLVGSARRLESRLSSQTLTSPIPEPHPISHVIPPRPFQILKSDRCHCNVFRLY